MKIILSICFILSFSIFSYAQNTWYMGTFSTDSVSKYHNMGANHSDIKFVYKIPNSQLLELTKKDKAEAFIKESTPTDTIDYKAIAEQVLPKGNYLIASVVSTRIMYEYVHVSSFKVKIYFYHDKKFILSVYDSLGYVIAKANLLLNNKQIPYSKEVQGFIINKTNKYVNYIVEVGNEIIALEFDGSKRKYSFKNNYYNDRTNKDGFIVLDKPKYRIGDTLHYKAFIYTKKGKAYKKPLELYLDQGYDNDYIDTIIKPQFPGVFMGSIIITDSFDLDKTYDLSIENSKNRNYVSVETYFDIEDYQLDKYTLNVSLDKKEIYNKGGIELSIIAKDAKGNYIQGGRYEIIVKSTNAEFYDSLNHFVPNEIIKRQGAILAFQPTKVRLNADELLNADAHYSMEIKTWNSANEMHSTNLSFKNTISPSLELKYRFDTINYIVHNNDGWQLQLQYSDSLRILVADSESVRIDYAEELPIFKLVKGNQSKQFSIKRYAMPRVISYRNGTKLWLQNINIHQVQMKLQVYEAKKLIYQNAFINIDTIFDINIDQYIEVYSSFQYDGDLDENVVRLTNQKNDYQINVELPDSVYPGEEVIMKIKVTDYQSKPVKGANITTYAVNSEFGSDINSPYFAYPQNILDNSIYNEAYYDMDLSDLGFRKSLTKNARSKFQISDSNLNYRMRYPDRGLFIYSYAQARGYCHFSPYLVSHGKFEEIYYVLIDDVPVYLANYNNRPWSFEFVPGIHTVKIRSIDKLYTLDSIRLKSNFKTDFFLDINNVPDSVLVEKRKNKLSKQEIKLFKNYTKKILVPYRYGRDRERAVLQGNAVYPTSGYTSTYISPLFNGNFLYLGNQTVASKIRKNYNSYKFVDNAFIPDKGGFYFTKKLAGYNRNVLKSQYSYKNLGVYSLRIFSKDTIVVEKPIILPFFQQMNSKCEVNIKLTNKLISPSDIYLCNLVSGNTIKYANSNTYPKMTDGFNIDVNSGNYQIIAFTKGNNILIYNAKLEAKGNNYLNLGSDFTSYIPFNTLSRSEKDTLVWKLFYGDKLKLENKGDYSIGTTNVYKRQDPFIPFYLIDKEDNKLCSARIYYYNADTNQKQLSAQIITEIPRQDSLFEVFVYSEHYKTKVFQINPFQSHADFIIVYLDKETDLIKISKKQHSFINSYKRRFYPYEHKVSRRYRASGHATVRHLGGGKSINCPSFGYTLEESNASGNYIDGVRVMEISKMPGRNASSMAVTVGGVYSYASPLIAFDRTNSGILEYKFGGTPAMFGDMVGDSSMSYLPKQIRKNFSDVGFWVPNLVTDENGYAEVKVRFPENITQWKVEAIAVGDKKKAGIFHKSVIASKQQLARLETPRFLTEGDRCLINTKLINYSRKPLLISDYFKLNGNLINTQKHELDSFIIQQQLVVANTSMQEVEFGFTAKGGIHDAEQRIIEVVPQGSWHSEGAFFMLDGDTTLIIPAQDKDGKLIIYNDLLEVMLSDIERIKTYKYDCNEQKASKLIALLLQEQIDDYLGIKFKQKRLIKGLIKSLDNNKVSGFKWGWWPDSKPESWISNHVLYALILAEAKGYSIDLSYNRYINSQAQISNNAQLRYISALDKRITINPTLIHWKLDDLKTEAQLWNLKAKKEYNMEVSVKEVLALSHSTIKGGLYWGENDYSHIENKILCTSLAFELIHEIDSTNAALEQILQFLLAHHGFDKMNTYEMAYMVNAVAPYLLAPNSKLPTSSITDQSGITIPFEQEITIKAGETYTLNKKGKSKIFGMRYQQYFDKKPEKVDSLFKVQTQFFIKDSLVNSFVSGDQVKIKITIESKKLADYTMLEIPLPASCTYSENEVSTNLNEVHRERYKDRLIIYCESLPAGINVFHINLQARFAGDYHINPTSVKEMYYPFFFGRNGMKKVNVNKD